MIQEPDISASDYILRLNGGNKMARKAFRQSIAHFKIKKRTMKSWNGIFETWVSNTPGTTLEEPISEIKKTMDHKIKKNRDKIREEIINE